MKFEDHLAELEKENKIWDSYFYDQSNCLVNKLGITDAKMLEKQETVIINAKMMIVNEIMNVMYGDAFTAERLFSIHDFLFSDIYAWAGTKRDVDIFKNEKVLDNQSVEYADKELIDTYVKEVMKNYNSPIWNIASHEQKVEGWCQCIAELWQTHPFREGNTRTCTIFALEFAKKIGLSIESMNLVCKHKEFRDALVLYSTGKVDTLLEMINEIEGTVQEKIETQIQGKQR